MGLFDIFKKKSALDAINIVPVLPQEMYESGKMELADTLAPSALAIKPQYMELGDKIVKSYFIVSYPRFIVDGWLEPIINLDSIYDVAIHIHPIATDKILKEFQKKVAEVQSQIFERESKGMVRDPILETAYHDLEELRDGLQQAQERVFDIGLYMTLYAKDDEELSKVENTIRSLLESKLIYVKPALFQQAEGFKSVIPLADDYLQVNSKLNSGPVSSFFPFISFDLSMDSGILYGINSHNASLIIFDRFKMPNYNSVLFATSGAGKSYATKLEILRTMMFDTEVIVIDPEREYEFLAEAVGGRYFNISLSSEHHINPFDLPEPLEDEDPKDVLRSNIIHLVGLFRILLGGLTPEEDSIIDRGITETYALKDITPESNFKDVAVPLLSDFEIVLASMEGSESLVERLKKYTKGTWAGFLNQPSNVDINKKLAVFSIRDMEDDLKPAAMYIITHYIWNKIRDRKNLRKRLLVVDEAWTMMQSEDAASFLFSMAKRGRKYYLGLATITQDVNDFLDSQYGSKIITNSSIQILLRQSPVAIDNIQKVFHLTQQEKDALLKAPVGHGIFFAGNKHVAIEIVGSPTEDQIVTSTPEQLMAQKKAKEEFIKNLNPETVTPNDKDLYRES